MKIDEGHNTVEVLKITFRVIFMAIVVETKIKLNDAHHGPKDSSKDKKIVQC